MEHPAHEEGSAAPTTVATVELDETRRTLTVVLVDGTRFELAPEAPEARGITPGLRLAPARRSELEYAAVRKQIARQVFALLDRRARTRAELRERLLARGYESAPVELVLDQCVAQGLVDDLAFARQWVAAQQRRRGVGARWLHARLRSLGVEEETVRAVLGEVREDTDEIAEALRALATRRLDLEAEVHRRRAARFLQSRGFSSSAILGALERARRAARSGD